MQKAGLNGWEMFVPEGVEEIAPVHRTASAAAVRLMKFRKGKRSFFR